MDKPGLENIFQEGRVLLFDKPLYWTSFDLVNKVRLMIRKAYGMKKLKVGHAGTLDPLATGLMILCTGRATKTIEEYRELDKEYYASLYFGKTTPSFDLETETDGNYPVEHITREIVENVLRGFIGNQKQVPPLHSAKLVNGKRAYEYARSGKNLELSPVNVIIREAEIVSFGIPETLIRILCSKGTYIRAFARDLGYALDSGCYLSALERSSIGKFKLQDALTIEKFEKILEQLKQI
ncbi:MAG: tRNA pseudouridine(55) synthase TruB [Bacteroidales bacterium]|jgi:tRNA pseudouridine55 synthase|nr:tRNA pseudouridine(55) synthase TruB [Bacteroidales bacterium]